MQDESEENKFSFNKIANRETEQQSKESGRGSVGVGVMEGKEGPRGARATGDGWLAVEGKRVRAGVEGTERIGDTGERRN